MKVILTLVFIFFIGTSATAQVNTQAQNDMNWYLMRNPTDAGGMLKWIEE